MPAQGLVLACSSTPQVVAGSLTAPFTAASSTHGYIRVLLKSIAGTAYLGDSGVTTAGYPQSTADAPQLVQIITGETLWASSTGSGVSLAILRLNETT